MRLYKISGDPIVTIGSPARKIVHAAEVLKAELIAIGSVGRTGLQRLLLGSVAEEVVRTAPCLVLVVRLHRSL